MDVNHFLLSSLLARWRSETHTFHFPHGETTVTLEDVTVLLGLPIDEDVVTGPTTVQAIFSTFHEHLGVIPPPTVIRGNSIRVSWLNTTFQQLPPNANNDVICNIPREYYFKINNKRNKFINNHLGKNPNAGKFQFIKIVRQNS